MIEGTEGADGGGVAALGLLHILFLDLAHEAGGAPFGAVFEGVRIRAFGRRRAERGGIGRLDVVERDEVVADARVQGRHGQLRAVADLDEVFARLRQLGFEVQHIGADGAARLEAFLGDAEAFFDAGHGLGLHGGKRLGLQDAVEAAGDFVNQLVAGGGETFGAGLRAIAGHAFSGIALEVEEPPLGGEAAAEVVGVVGLVRIEGGVHHVQGALIEGHHERLRGIVAAGIGGGEADGGIVVGLGLAEHGLGGIDAAFGGLQRRAVGEGGLDGLVQSDGPCGGGREAGGEEKKG